MKIYSAIFVLLFWLFLDYDSTNCQFSKNFQFKFENFGGIDFSYSPPMGSFKNHVVIVLLFFDHPPPLMDNFYLCTKRVKKANFRPTTHPLLSTFMTCCFSAFFFFVADSKIMMPNSIQNKALNISENFLWTTLLLYVWAPQIIKM
jgi:hypothetical protein